MGTSDFVPKLEGSVAGLKQVQPRETEPLNLWGLMLTPDCLVSVKLN